MLSSMALAPRVLLRPCVVCSVALLGGCKDDPVPQSCEPVETWSPGTPVFRDVTEDWGLTGVEGTRISVADLEGDGWPDLLVRNGQDPDDFSEGGERTRWVLRNTGTGTLEDVTESSGLFAPREGASGNRPGQTVGSADVDNDGDLDIFVGAARYGDSGETSELMLNDGTGHFVLGPEESEARFESVDSQPASVSFLDHDRDGNADLWVTHYQNGSGAALQDRLLLGDGQGGFEDVTETLGLKTKAWSSVGQINKAKAHSVSWSGAACDLDGDGLEELLAASYGRAPNHLWHSQGAGDGFTNASIDSGYAFDHRDDWSDNVSAQCYCADHRSAEGCADVPEASTSLCDSFRDTFGPNYRWNHENDREPFRLGGNSGTAVCADLDNDGFQELITQEIVHWDVGTSSDPSEILVNTGESPPRFERPGNDATGLTREIIGSNWNHGDITGAALDFDNDGLLDLYIGASEYADNHGLLYRNLGGMEFEALAVGDYFERFRSHGVATADLDRDGDMDLIVGHSRSRCGDTGECESIQQVRIFENLVGQDGGWVQLELEGRDSNRMGLGARVTLETPDGPVYRFVDGGHGHFGMQNEALLTLGIGSKCASEVTVRWPDGSKDTHEVQPNKRYRWVQGEGPSEVE